MTRSYLGDGVFVDTDGAGGIVLTTENGISVTNTIYLEPEVFDALVAWETRRREELTARTKENR